jgi:predicted aspartyl protease
MAGTWLRAKLLAARTCGACVLAALLCTVAPSAGQASPAEDVAEPEPLYAAPSRLDRAGRVLVAVEVNGQGPFRFIVDTGANRSAISPETAAKLGLSPGTQTAVDVHGVTGSAMLPSVDIVSLRAGEILMPRRRLPVLASAVFAGADGILGIEGLSNARIEVDFVNDRVSIAPSTGRRVASDSLIVPVRLKHGGLLMADGRMGGVRVHVVVDTGAERTLGNLPLRDALLHRVPSDRRSATTVLGATPEIATGLSFEAPALHLGEARLVNLPVTFGDLHVFTLWGLADEPALVIGMDLIGTLRQFAVDYRRKELQLTTFLPTLPNLRKCGPNECQSRIPPPADGT